MKDRKIRDTLIYTKITEMEESIDAIREHLPLHVLGAYYSLKPFHFKTFPWVVRNVREDL